jgi:membrane-associated protease RseP (regulator of RpoE activity)
MKSSDSITYSKSGSVINTNIEKLVKGNFSPGSLSTPYSVVVPKGKASNSKDIFKMIMGIVYFVLLVYFLSRFLT